ncbi:hypothetical protein FB446DRAFT_717036 [Lentinula raphanica]|nr:hypothetical protein FB446DRAFT_717036 [Lentinula raphanica]
MSTDGRVLVRLLPAAFLSRSVGLCTCPIPSFSLAASHHVQSVLLLLASTLELAALYSIGQSPGTSSTSSPMCIVIIDLVIHICLSLELQAMANQRVDTIALPGRSVFDFPSFTDSNQAGTK